MSDILKFAFAMFLLDFMRKKESENFADNIMLVWPPEKPLPGEVFYQDMIKKLEAEVEQMWSELQQGRDKGE